MISLALPEFLLAALLVLALAAYMFRRLGGWTPAGGALALVGLALWILRGVSEGAATLLFSLFQVDMLVAVHWQGFVLQMTPNVAPVVVFMLLLGGAVLALAAFVHQPDAFPAFALALVAGCIGFLLLREAPISPYLLTPGFLALVTALGVYPLQAGRLGDVSGALRFLLLPVLALPLFLLAAWYADQLALNPQEAAAATAAARLLSFGLLLLLAPVPFHSAWPALVQRSPPLVGVLLTLVYQMIVLFILHRVAVAYPFVVTESNLSLWLTGTGVLTALWAGVAAVGASHPGRLLGYAFLHEWGLILLILAAPGSRSWPLVLFLFVLRAVSGLTASVGLAYLAERTGNLDADRLWGVGARLPWSTTAYVLGGLGLAGFPLTAGFTGHWAALQMVAQIDWRVAAVVLLASAGIVVGFVRQVRILFGPLADPFLAQERLRNGIVALLVILVSTGLAIAPQLLDAPIAWGLTAFGG